MLEQLREALRDDYAVESELGGGGMSRVFLATDLKLRRRIVIKVLPPELGNTLSVDRFEREIHLSARLRHPHIVPLLNAGKAGDLLFYTMPFIEGESLQSRLKAGPLRVDEARRLAAEVADALSYAHGNNVVHRDIKPANILLDSGHAVVTDFGIARAISESGLHRGTETGYGLGTPGYMSPEQATGDKEIDGRSDVYSLGCVLYEMLTGKPPVAAGMSTDLSELSAVLPVLTRALASNRDERFSSATAFRDALQDPTHVHRRRQRRFLAAAGVVVAAAAVAAFTLGRHGAETGPVEWTRRRVSFVGNAFNPVLAPDGGSVAYSSGPTILVTDLRTGDTRPVVTHKSGVGSITWTMSGAELAFKAIDTVYAVATSGGPTRVVVDRVFGTFALSEDGSSVAWHSSVDAKSVLLVKTRQLRSPRGFDIRGGSMSWSPNGRRLALTTAPNASFNLPLTARPKAADVIVITPDDSTMETVPGVHTQGPVWWRDDKTVCSNRMVIGADSTAGCVVIGRIWPGRERFQRLDEASTSPFGRGGRGGSAAMTSTVGRHVAYVEAASDARVWSYALSADGHLSNRSLATPTTAYATSYSESPAGDFRAFVARGMSGRDVFLQSAADSIPRRITRLGAASIRPVAWSPDGKQIAAMVEDDSLGGIYVLDRDGREIRRVVSDRDDGFRTGLGWPIAWAADGQSVFTVRDSLRRVDLATGKRTALAGNPHAIPVMANVVVSPSGQRVGAINYKGAFAVYDFATSRSSEIRFPFDLHPIRWIRENEIIAASDRYGIPTTLWRVSLDGTPPKRLAQLLVNCVHVWVAADLSRLTCAEAERTSDVWVATRSTGGR